MITVKTEDVHLVVVGFIQDFLSWYMIIIHKHLCFNVIS